MSVEALFERIDAMDWSGAAETLKQMDLTQQVRGPQGQSPVQESIYRGGREFAESLADRVANLDQFECTVLARAEALERILTATPGQIDAKSYDGWTALHLAGFVGAESCAALLLERGAPVNEPSSNNMANSPLAATLAGSGNQQIVALLLNADADPNQAGAGGFTPLHLAASRGSVDAIAALQQAGATPVAAENGLTPADLAAERGFPDAAQAVS